MSFEGRVREARLVRVNGQEDDTFQTVIPLRKNNIKIGRAPECDIVLDSLQISRRHATLEFMGSSWYLRDTSSSGITVNGEQVRKGTLIALSNSIVIDFVSAEVGLVQYQFQSDEAHSSYSSRRLPQTRPASSYHQPQPSTSAAMFPSQGKHKIEDTSGSEDIAHGKKKKIFQTESSSDEDSSHSFRSCQSTPSSQEWTNESVKNDEVEALKEQLGTCMSKLGALQQQLEHSESLNAAIREESLQKTHELMESEMSCGICKQVFIQATVIDCGHTFCCFCINHWSRTKKECPVCRRAFQNMVLNVETESFITKAYESLTPELRALRATSITEREAEARRAQEDAQNPNPNPPRRRNIQEYVVLREDGEFDYVIEVEVPSDTDSEDEGVVPE